MAAREFMDTFMQRFFDELPFDYIGKAKLIPDQVQDWLRSSGVGSNRARTTSNQLELPPASVSRPSHDC